MVVEIKGEGGAVEQVSGPESTDQKMEEGEAAIKRQRID
jgi:hypothetical protein